MSEKIHTGPQRNQSRSPSTDRGESHPFLQALLGGRHTEEAGQAMRQRAGERVARCVRGLTFAGVAYLFGSCPLFLDTAPLGLALLSASSSYTWYILAGLIVSALTKPVTLTSSVWVCMYLFCILLRLAVLFFIDPPLLPGEQGQPDGRTGFRSGLKYAGRYLSLCLRSAAVRIGIRMPESQTSADTHTDYYSGVSTGLGKDTDDAIPETNTHTDPASSSPSFAAKHTECVSSARPFPSAHLFCEHPFLRTLTGAVSGFGAGIAGMVAGHFHVYDLLGALFLIICVPVAVILLIPSFTAAGESLLFSPRPLWDTEESKTPGKNRLLTRFHVMPLVSVSALLLSVVFCARTFSPMLGTPYLTIRMSTLLGLLLTLSATTRLGLVPGVPVAILVGLGAGPTLLPIFLLTATVYAFLHILSHTVGVIGGCLAGAIWCAACGDLAVLVTQLPSVILAIPLFFLCERLWERLPPVTREVELHLTDFTLAVAEEARLDAQRTRLSALSDAFADLSREFYHLSAQLRQPRMTDLSRICDKAFADRCASCPHRAACQAASGERTWEVSQRLATQLKNQGKASLYALPTFLREYCPHMEEIIQDINTRCAHLTEALVRGEKTEVVAADYAHMSSLLSDTLEGSSEEYRCNREAADAVYEYLTSIGLGVQGVVVCGKRTCRIIVRGTRMERASAHPDAIRDKLGEICKARLTMPAFETVEDYTIMTLSTMPRITPVYAGSTVPAGTAAGEALPSPMTDQTPPGEYLPPAVCGDHIAIFKNPQACFYALISDGMGSGEEASLTSDICAVFLEKMLSAGSRVEISLQMLNTFIRSKNTGTGEECSATVDLMELDLMGGQAVFAKSGASPTYVVRGGTVYKLRSRSLPLGILRESDPQLLRFRMHPGDVVVMVSDGVTMGNDECPWLIDLLSDPLPESMDRLRLDILRRAIASGSPDDLSAIAIRVENSH